jgi:hypothetical protein
MLKKLPNLPGATIDPKLIGGTRISGPRDDSGTVMAVLFVGGGATKVPFPALDEAEAFIDEMVAAANADPAEKRLAALLPVVDNISVLNGGPQVINGFDFVAIRREDFDALVALRGSDAEILARQSPSVPD